MRYVILFLLLIGATAVGDEPDVGAMVTPLADKAVTDKQIVGMSIGVIYGDQRRSFHFGRTSLDGDKGPDDETYYEIGSITKTFTGILLADAARRGEVKLDDPINKYLPADTQLADNGSPVTLGDIASHTSGLPRMPRNFYPGDPANPYADYSITQMYDFIRGLKPDRPPGEKYEYSNLAMGLLGHALAHNVDRTWEELCTERLTGPLGMKETRLNWTRDMHERMAPGHDAKLRPASNWDIPTFAGAGGLRSTITDMLKYAQANIAPPDNDLGKAITDSHVQRHTYGDRPGGMALGWHIGAATDFRWHTGQTGGYHSYMAFSSKHKIAVIVLSNTGTGAVDAVGESILAALHGEVLKSQQGALTPQTTRE